MDSYQLHKNEPTKAGQSWSNLVTLPKVRKAGDIRNVPGLETSGVRSSTSIGTFRKVQVQTSVPARRNEEHTVHLPFPSLSYLTA